MINVISFLENSSRKCPDKIALRDENDSINYLDLYFTALKVATKINSVCKNNKQPVVIISDRTINSIIAIWGVLAAGDYYINIDVKTPLERIKTILNLVNPSVVLVTKERVLEDIKIPILNISEECFSEKTCLCGSVNDFSSEVNSCIIDQDPAYMVLTSGSTGTPKAVVKSHRSIIEFTETFIDRFQLKNDEIFANQASFDFDVSAKDIYVTARLGATMCILPTKCFLMPKTILPLLNKWEVTCLIWAASAIKYVQRMNCLEGTRNDTIKNIFFSGEPMPYATIKYWKKYIPDARYVNLYAPSEITGNCLLYEVDEVNCEGILPLKESFSNMENIVIDDEGNRVQDNGRGELYVRGAFMSQGYYNNLVTTNSVFVQNPLNEKFLDVIYKTGDFMTVRNGLLFFSGRRDNQIKHMGHRIELEEIENAIYTLFEVSLVCVVYDSEAEKIVLLVDNKEITYNDIVARLKNVIPKYMMPSEVVQLDRVPLNSRGKVDRVGALEMYRKGRGAV